MDAPSTFSSLLTRIDPEVLADLKHLNMQFMEYTPQTAQLPVHESRHSVLVISGGEGSGKSKVTASEIAARYGTWERVLFVCYKGESAKNESDYMYASLKRFGAVRSYSTPRGGNIQLITREGAVVESISTYAEGEKAVSGTGKSYDIIAMLEAGKQSYAVYLACLLRISRKGGLLILSGTIEKSEPWFPDLVNKLQGENEIDAQVIILPTWENHIDYPGGRDDPKIKALEHTLPPDLFLERLAGKPSPAQSLVFKDFSFLTHVFDWVRYDPSEPVEVWIDPGYSGSHYSVNFVQMHPRAYTRRFYDKLPDVPLTDVWVIGDLYLDHAIHEEVIQECQKLEWWSRVNGGVGDVVIKTHPMAGRAPIDVWLTKAGIFLRGQPVSIQDGIDRHHTFLRDPASGSPRIFFNPSCVGTREYSKWKRKEIGENVYGAPEATNCDCLKAIQYGLIDHFGRIEPILPAQVVVTGERVQFQDAQNKLPAPDTQRQVSVSVATASPQYIVTPRLPRAPVGGLPTRRIGQDV